MNIPLHPRHARNDFSATSASRSHRTLRRGLKLALLLAAGCLARPASAQTLYLLTEDNKLATTNATIPGVISDALPITGVLAGDTLVAIDVRPQNQRLYALGVNSVENTFTLYHLAPQTGVAAAVGTSTGFTTNGVTDVDLPPSGYDIDFNPAVDRLRVVTETGLNFRINPNNGAGIDGDNTGSSSGVVTGTNPDGGINGATVLVGGAAYTNNQPNNGNITTLYTVDPATNALFIQNPANSGTQTLGQTITFAGLPLNFTSASFDIVPGVNAAASNAAVVSGSGLLVAKVAGVSNLYRLNLTNAQATLIATLQLGVRSACLRTDLGAAVALTTGGTSLMRFSPETPGTTVTVAITGVTAGESLVGIDGRPQTGQLVGLGVNSTANNATLYLIDPQNGAASVIGAVSSISFVAGGSTVDLPDPATTGYGVNFNPTVDRIRVVTGTGLNFRLNPVTGLAVDSDPIAVGNNTDGNLNGGATGAVATAYTNSFGQPLTGGVTTQYSIDAASDTLFIQNPPNNGTLTAARPVTLGGFPLDFSSQLGFDIPQAVTVAASATPASGDGWLAATVGGVTNIYRLDLATGRAEFIQFLGTGTSPASGLVIWAARIPIGNDAVTTTGAPTRIDPLANDQLSPDFAITSVSNPEVIVDGRSLIIPAGFTGTFTYSVGNGALDGESTVTVVAGTPAANPTTFNGLVFADDGAIVGWATTTISAKGVATVRILGGANAVSAKATFVSGNPVATVFTKLGQLTLTSNPGDTVALAIDALGGDLTASLRPVQTSAEPATYHVALASVDPAYPGGGFAIAKVSKKGAVALSGVLPDGLAFTATSALGDNGTITFFSAVTKGAKPPAVLGGQFTTADLATTDLTGELYYAKLPQLQGATGTHLTGVETTLTANGSLFAGDIPLTGDGTLTVSGASLEAPASYAVTVSSKGVPNVAALTDSLVKSWTGVSPKVGKFTAKVTAPNVTKPVTGRGLYLPKSGQAWGYFPGKTEGGRIELFVPLN